MRPASPYAKTIVAAISAVAALLGVVVAPDQLEIVVAAIIAVGGVLGVWRVPNEEPDPILEQLAGEPLEGGTTTLGTPID